MIGGPTPAANLLRPRAVAHRQRVSSPMSVPTDADKFQ